MSNETFERLRLPIAVGVAVLLLAGYVILQRVDGGSSDATPSPTIIVGVPGGGVVASPTPTPSPTPSPAPTATPVVTESPSPTPTPSPQADFVADVLACRSISGAECNDEIRRLRDDDDTFVALLLFDNANAGDVMNVMLEGDDLQVEGGAYALPGSGRGWYYSTFVVTDLAPGEYTLTGIRNGEEIARTELRMSRDGDDD
jgi:hypothetical protein